MDTRVADELIGALVDGRYRVRSRVASGGMATVYTAVDERLERTVALKIIHPAQADDPRFVDRFIREAKTIARLTHPNVVSVYDQGTHQGLPYLVMEYVRGRTLRDMLADEHRLAPGDALAILEPMLAAIAAAHRGGVIHRDVKPENVLVAASPGGSGLVDAVVKVADFGLARAVEASAEDGDGQLLATVAYVAPELVSDGVSDPRTDVYSVGIVAFEMLTGRVPYDGAKPIDVAWAHVDQDVPPPGKYVPNLPPEVDALVVHATRRDPAHRPADAGALLAEVQAAREAMEAQGSLTARTVAQPTLPAEPARPNWARLPDGEQGRRRLGESGRRRAMPAARSGVHPAIAWFQGFMSRPNGRRTFYAGIAVLALLVAIGGWWFGAGRYTTTPTLTGQTRAAAEAALTKAGLKVRLAVPQWNEKIAKDTVLGQDPPAGADIVRGGTVTLTLSKGPERYAVPNDVGAPYDQTVSDLTAIKLVARKVLAYDDQIPAGVVLSMDPAPGTLQPPGTQITVKVSRGKAPITIPNVVGLDFNTANQQLSALGLTVAQVQKQDPTKPAGTVIKQSLNVGTGVTKGTTIVLTVSTGPPLVQVPDLTNQGISFDDAVARLQQLGLPAVAVANFPGGQVRQMSPAPGTMVPPGTQIQLWVY